MSHIITFVLSNTSPGRKLALSYPVPGDNFKHIYKLWHIVALVEICVPKAGDYSILCCWFFLYIIKCYV